MSHFNEEAGRKCLLETADILDYWGVPFFLIQGTALGAYRDKGFTPTERDIDFGILQEHLDRIAPELAMAFVQTGYQIESYSLPFSKCRTLVVWKYGIHVDLVGWMLWKGVRFTYSPVHPSVTEPYALVHDRKMLETYEPVELFDRMFVVPNPIETYLALEYGDDWRTPREDHVSRTRVYGFLEKEGVPNDLLDSPS